eukprot:5002203-Prymnesium_polylepis.1
MTGESSYERPAPAAPSAGLMQTELDARTLLVKHDEDGDGRLTMTELRQLLMAAPLTVPERDRAQALLYEYESARHAYIDLAGLSELLHRLHGVSAPRARNAPPPA